MTGWTWDYIEWNIDLPRLTALNKQWKQLPPLPIQMARIANYLGYKPSIEPKKNDELSGNLAHLVESMPMVSAPKILSPEEYLKRKEQINV